MGIIIKDIKILDDAYSVLNDETHERLLKNLSKINIFVGENNSGKSRLLRSFFTNKLSDEPDESIFPPLVFVPTDDSIIKLNDKNSSLILPEKNIFENLRSDFNNLKKELENLRNTKYKIIKTDSVIVAIHKYLDEIEINKLSPKKVSYFVPLKNLKSHLINLQKAYSTSTNGIDHVSVGETYLAILDQFLFKWGDGIFDLKLYFTFNRIYIPMLRGLRSLGGNDIYLNRTIMDYFRRSIEGKQLESMIKEERIEIFTGLNVYQEVKDHLLGDLNKRNLIKEYEEYLSKQFFDNKPIALIPKEDKKNEDGKIDEILTIKIGNEKEKPIYNLGDGIQSIIIMTLPLYLHKDENYVNSNNLVFIEEPENLLHPGLQRKLMDTFNDVENFSNFQFFITTHSNHFLDLSLDYEDISIFTIKKEFEDSELENKEEDPKFLVEDLSYGDTNALELLGVRNSSVFLSNCTIWVEGITDRYYIKNYFDIYQEYLNEKAKNRYIDFMEFREDYHYSFVEYAGSNIVHWSVLEGLGEADKINVDRLCGSIFLIADKDADDAKIERKDKLKENLKEGFYLLTCREIENLLSEDVLLEIIKDYQIGEDESEREKFVCEEFSRKDYIDEPLGGFITNNILKDISKKRKYGEKTIDSSLKLDFCKKAVDHTNELKNLSQDTIKLCNCIYKFIAEKNGYNSMIPMYEELCQECGLFKDI